MVEDACTLSEDQNHAAHAAPIVRAPLAPHARYFGDGRRQRCKHFALAAMKQQRFIALDQEMIERETRRWGDFRDVK